MVVVPGGSYDLGPNTGWERPERRVTLDHFAIDRHEVTCGMYALFVNALPMDRRDEMLPRGWDLDESGWSRFGDSQRDQPVVYVDLDQAMAYAAWAGKRLPTEDEWEAAAAGLERWVYPWGNDFTAGRTNGDGRHDFTLPVESFPESRSPAGCFDMSGNVWEWTTTYEDGTDFDEPPEELINVSIRGGAFNSPRDWLTTRYRWAAPGRDTFGSPRYTFPIGFRCAKDLR
jgi:formylglycine-generating enzyme required for sulfatase activity